MGTWGEVGQELLDRPRKDGKLDYDGVRRDYLRELFQYTKRSIILYETAGFSPPPGVSPNDISIAVQPDIQAFMEVVHGLPKNEPIDLIIHSPGGTVEAAEAIVKYLRGRFSHIRVIVPIAAMSAATMIALAADEIVMGTHSQLGPIDPQVTINTFEGPRTSPVAAVRQQFEEACEDISKHPSHAAAWDPIIRSMAPALLQTCEKAEELSKTIVSQWLVKYMFANRRDRSDAAKQVADALSDYSSFMSHARPLAPEQLRKLGLNITNLEDDQQLQDLVLSVHHAVSHTMYHAGVVKIVENHQGKIYLVIHQPMT